MLYAIVPGFYCPMPSFGFLRYLRCKICFEASHYIATRSPMDAVDVILRVS